MAEHFAHRRERVGGRPHVFADTSRLLATPGITATLLYYDTDNFARLVRVSDFYTWSDNEVTVLPTTSYALYNLITAHKTLHIVEETGHVQAPDQRARTDASLLP